MSSLSVQRRAIIRARPQPRAAEEHGAHVRVRRVCAHADGCHGHPYARYIAHMLPADPTLGGSDSGGGRPHGVWPARGPRGQRADSRAAPRGVRRRACSLGRGRPPTSTLGGDP